MKKSNIMQVSILRSGAKIGVQLVPTRSGQIVIDSLFQELFRDLNCCGGKFAVGIKYNGNWTIIDQMRKETIITQTLTDEDRKDILRSFESEEATINLQPLVGGNVEKGFVIWANLPQMKRGRI